MSEDLKSNPLEIDGENDNPVAEIHAVEHDPAFIAGGAESSELDGERAPITTWLEIQISFVTKRVDVHVHRDVITKILERYGQLSSFEMKKYARDTKLPTQSGYGFAAYENIEDGLHTFRSLKCADVDGIRFDCNFSHRNLQTFPQEKRERMLKVVEDLVNTKSLRQKRRDSTDDMDSLQKGVSAMNVLSQAPQAPAPSDNMYSNSAPMYSYPSPVSPNQVTYVAYGPQPGNLVQPAMYYPNYNPPLPSYPAPMGANPQQYMQPQMMHSIMPPAQPYPQVQYQQSQPMNQYYANPPTQLPFGSFFIPRVPSDSSLYGMTSVSSASTPHSRHGISSSTSISSSNSRSVGEDSFYSQRNQGRYSNNNSIQDMNNTSMYSIGLGYNERDGNNSNNSSHSGRTHQARARHLVPHASSSSLHSQMRSPYNSTYYKKPSDPPTEDI